MVCVFALFGTLSSLELKQAGVGLAAAVLIDATADPRRAPPGNDEAARRLELVPAAQPQWLPSSPTNDLNPRASSSPRWKSAGDRRSRRQHGRFGHSRAIGKDDGAHEEPDRIPPRDSVAVWRSLVFTELLRQLRTASVLQASGFRSDVTVFRLNAARREILAWNLRLGGIRRNAYTKSRRLITRRSQVQILPPLLQEVRKCGPFVSGSRAANAAAHLRGRDLDRVPVEFADCEARGLVNERPSRSCASG